MSDSFRIAPKVTLSREAADCGMPEALSSAVSGFLAVRSPEVTAGVMVTGKAEPTLYSQQQCPPPMPPGGPAAVRWSCPDVVRVMQVPQGKT